LRRRIHSVSHARAPAEGRHGSRSRDRDVLHGRARLGRGARCGGGADDWPSAP
jgi:hypothetical protein